MSLSISKTSTERSFPWASLISAATASVPVSIFIFTAVAIPLTAAQAFGLTSTQTIAWISAIHLFAAFLSFSFSFRYRQPLLFAFSTSGVIFAASFAGRAPFTDLLGASLLAGVTVFALSISGLTKKVAEWFPVPIVMAMLAGAIFPYVSGIFTSFNSFPAPIGAGIVAYVLGRKFLGSRVPAILPTVLFIFLGAFYSGTLNLSSLHALTFTLPSFSFQMPTFRIETLVSVTPVLVALIALQGNLPAVVFLRGQGYQPPFKKIDGATGLAALVGSFFGVTPTCMASLLTAATAGPEAGEMQRRHWSVYISASSHLFIGIFAAVVVGLLGVFPIVLLKAIAGFALIGVLLNALQQALKGPLVLGPLLSFSIAVSQFTLLSFGPLFWALVTGMLTTVLLEGEQLKALRKTAS